MLHGRRMASMDTTTMSTSTAAVPAKKKEDLLAYQQSFGFFDDIPDDMWEKKQDLATSFNQFRHPENPSNNHKSEFMWWLNNIQPNFSCPYMKRVGGNGDPHGDGPKWICDPERLGQRTTGNNGNSNTNCLIYSIGSAGKYRFEDGLIEMHGKEKCEFHVFDPGHYDRKGDAQNKNIHYHQWGITSSYDTNYKIDIPPKDREGAVFLSIQETMKRLGHEGRTIDIFKIDCENCEWATYKDWIDIDMRQILIEVHGVASPEPKGNKWYPGAMDVGDFYKSFFDRGYALFYKEPNGSCCQELGFVKLDKGFFKKKRPEIQ